MSADMKIKFADIDIFYLSYDEPNYQEHWADIRNKVPWAKHVHGVEGSDAAGPKPLDSDRPHHVVRDGVVGIVLVQVGLVICTGGSANEGQAR